MQFKLFAGQTGARRRLLLVVSGLAGGETLLARTAPRRGRSSNDHRPTWWNLLAREKWARTGGQHTNEAKCTNCGSRTRRSKRLVLLRSRGPRLPRQTKIRAGPVRALGLAPVRLREICFYCLSLARLISDSLMICFFLSSFLSSSLQPAPRVASQPASWAPLEPAPRPLARMAAIWRPLLAG